MAGGGIKINNISVSGGVDGKTPIFKVEGGYLYNSYDNGNSWYQLAEVKGKDGINGKDGATGAKLVSQVLQGKDANGGNIYLQTFDDGTTAYFTAPRGEQGLQGENGTDHSTEIEQLRTEIDGAHQDIMSLGNITATMQDEIAVLKEDSEFYNTEINELWWQVENHAVELDEQADKIETNKKELHNIKQALLQNEVLVVSKIQNKTTTRVTAGGENIVDEQYTPVLEIKGSTVADSETNTLKRAYIKSIKSTGRNVWDEQVEAGNIDSLGVLYGDSRNGIRSKNYTRVVPNTVYYKKGAAGNFNFYDANKKFLGVQFVVGNSNFTTPNNCHYIKFGFYSSYGNVYKNDVCINISDDNFNGKYEPYTEEIYELPKELINLYPNGIPEYDRFNPQTGELIRQTGSATSETGFTEEEVAGYDGAIVSSDKLSLEYKLATPTTTTIYNSPKGYTAWDKGSETIIQGTIDNSKYGAIPTVTNEYILKIGGEE